MLAPISRPQLRKIDYWSDEGTVRSAGGWDGQTRTAAIADGFAARNAGSAHSPNAGSGRGSRPHHRAHHRASFGRGPAGRARLTLPRSTSARGPRLDRLLLGHL